MLTHNTTHNEVMEGISRNAHAPARRCHVHGVLWLSIHKDC